MDQIWSIHNIISGSSDDPSSCTGWHPDDPYLIADHIMMIHISHQMDQLLDPCPPSLVHIHEIHILHHWIISPWSIWLAIRSLPDPCDPSIGSFHQHHDQPSSSPSSRDDHDVAIAAVLLLCCCCWWWWCCVSESFLCVCLCCVVVVVVVVVTHSWSCSATCGWTTALPLSYEFVLTWSRHAATAQTIWFENFYCNPIESIDTKQ